MNILIAVVTVLILVHLCIWLIKKLLRSILSVLRRGGSIVRENEEEIKKTYRKSKETCKESIHAIKEAIKDSLPARETVTTGQRSAAKIIALFVVGMLVGAFSFGAIAIGILSNFNFAAGMY